MNEIPSNNNTKDLKKSQEVELLVQTLFSDLTNNKDIPASFKATLAQLKQSYLTISQEMPNLFTFENHQARAFLQHAITASIDWKSLEDSHNTFQKKLDKAVKVLIDQTRYNNKLYTHHQMTLEKTLVQLKKRADIKIKRLHEKQIGQKKINDAKQHTQQILSSKLSHVKSSTYISKLLIDEWTNVLVLLHIRHGINSIVYQSKLDFVDLLLQTALQSPQQKLPKQLHKIIFEKYQKGLQLVAFNHQEIENKIKKLNRFFEPQLHKTAIQIPEVNSSAIQAQEIQGSNSEAITASKPSTSLKQALKDVPNEARKEMPKKIPIVSPQTISDAAAANEKQTAKPVDTQDLEKIQFKKQKPNHSVAIKTTEKLTKKPIPRTTTKTPLVDSAQIIKNLKIGNWFELTTAEGKKVKAKLSWISPITGKLLFVDSQGLKLSDKKTSELECGLKDQSIKTLNKYS